MTTNILLNNDFGRDGFRVLHTKVFQAHFTFLIEEEGSGSARVRRNGGLPGGGKRDRRKGRRVLGGEGEGRGRNDRLISPLPTLVVLNHWEALVLSNS